MGLGPHGGSSCLRCRCAQASSRQHDGVVRDQQIERRIDLGPDRFALIFSAFNYERGKIYGIELSGSYKSTNLTAYANLAYSRALGKGIETGQFNFDPDELDCSAPKAKGPTGPGLIA